MNSSHICLRLHNCHLINCSRSSKNNCVFVPWSFLERVVQARLSLLKYCSNILLQNQRVDYLEPFSRGILWNSRCLLLILYWRHLEMQKQLEMIIQVDLESLSIYIWILKQEELVAQKLTIIFLKKVELLKLVNRRGIITYFISWLLQKYLNYVHFLSNNRIKKFQLIWIFKMRRFKISEEWQRRIWRDWSMLR